MHRPVGVSVAAIFLGLFSIVSFFLTIIVMQVIARSHPSTNAIAAAVVVPSVAATIYMGCITIGLFRGKNWARLGGIVLGIVVSLVAVWLLLTITASFGILQLRPHTATLHPALLIAGLSCVATAIFGIWLAIYLNTTQVRAGFQPSVVFAPDTIAYPAPPFAMDSLVGASILPSVDAPAHGYTRISLPAPAGNATSLARILVLTFCVIGTLTCVYLLAHPFSGKPSFYLGILMQGRSANAFHIFVGITLIALNTGVFLRYIPAYYGLLITQISNIVSLSLMIFPAYRAKSVVHTTAALTHAIDTHAVALAQAIRVAYIVFSVLFSILFVWALWRDLSNIRQSKQPAVLDSPPITESEPRL